MLTDQTLNIWQLWLKSTVPHHKEGVSPLWTAGESHQYNSTAHWASVYGTGRTLSPCATGVCMCERNTNNIYIAVLKLLVQ